MSHKPKTPWYVWLILAAFALSALFIVVKLFYDNVQSSGYQKGRSDASAEYEISNPDSNKNYSNGLMTKCLTNGRVPFDLQSDKPLRDVCSCANSVMTQQAITAGKGLSDYHTNDLSAEQEKLIYQSCL